MNFKNQYCSLQQGLILNQLGIGSPLYRICRNSQGEESIFQEGIMTPLQYDPVLGGMFAGVYSVAELGEMLSNTEPVSFISFWHPYSSEWQCHVTINKTNGDLDIQHLYEGYGNTEAKCRADALIHLMEIDFEYKHFFTAQAVNERLRAEQSL